ncbi:hypothetical protein M9Y10_008986 [Tritrichomonas musculus]|uniref:Initiator binding domain-containing protein n=1 Tax=Tritrichomonas musculus TaxID=1915356 RepID=A0ABR2J0S2_9EUKA
MISDIQEYCIQDDNNNEFRCLVCGIFWLKRSIAINISQLSILMGKCQSSINNSLQKMGYKCISKKISFTFYNNQHDLQDNGVTQPSLNKSIQSLSQSSNVMSCSCKNELIQKAPFLKMNTGELRKWSIRYLYNIYENNIYSKDKDKKGKTVSEKLKMQTDTQPHQADQTVDLDKNNQTEKYFINFHTSSSDVEDITDFDELYL